MPEPDTLLVFGAASVVVLAIPGPAVIYIVSRSLAEGRRAGIVSALGIQAGGLIHVTAATVGPSAARGPGRSGRPRRPPPGRNAASAPPSAAGA